MGGSFEYDQNGSMWVRNGVGITWDVENRMTAYGSTATFTYDGDGKRVAKTEGGFPRLVLYLTSSRSELRKHARTG